jgi:hypothetical protein
MMLRRSGEVSEKLYNVMGVIGDDAVGVEDEELLVAIADAVVAGDRAELAHVRAKAVHAIGAEKLVGAIGIASGFDGITKVANATRILLDAKTQEATVSLRQQTGIDDYSENHKSSTCD